MPDTPWTHAESYRGAGLVARLHRRRLATIVRTLRALPLPPAGRLADFGCSDGFVIAGLRRDLWPPDRWELCGFDHQPRLIELARARHVARTTFATFDLDAVALATPRGFDVALCLETLEHVGNWRTALFHLAGAVEPGGFLVISVPNETGFAGLAKFFGRQLVRRRPYDGFFQGRPRWPYVRALLTHADIERFREPARHGWADHLGFDVRRLEAALGAPLPGGATIERVLRRRTALGFGRLFVLQRPRQA